MSAAALGARAHRASHLVGTERLGRQRRGGVAAWAARPGRELMAAALVHGYSTAFWWSAAIFAFGALVAVTLLRRGPLAGQRASSPAPREPASVP
ncbi:MAG: hypothetical protein ACM3ML_02660 [Micromonosporaceae bacterium]